MEKRSKKNKLKKHEKNDIRKKKKRKKKENSLVFNVKREGKEHRTSPIDT